MRGWRSAKWSATMIWVRVHDLYSAKAVMQNEYMDFLRDIVPMTMPLSMALKLREERDPPTAEPSDAPQQDKEQASDAAGLGRERRVHGRGRPRRVTAGGVGWPRGVAG